MTFRCYATLNYNANGAMLAHTQSCKVYWSTPTLD